MNNLDYIFIGLIAILALWGFLKGFLASVIGLGGYVAAFYGARIWGETVGTWFKNTGMINSLQNTINSNLASIGVNGMDPEATSTVLNDPKIGSVIVNNPIYKALFDSQAVTTNASNGVTTLLINIVCTCLGYILVFLAIKIAVGLIGSLVSAALKTSQTMSFADRLLGFILGSAMGVALSIAIITFIIPIVMSYSTKVADLVHNSVLSAILLRIANLII
ncbi:CvpA family protein [Clostridium sp. 'deep sea']|uniref:CvpA family protein n=1 Tax=Clostridium sp. 'deep sea' TaxID=2779445 RepID=UPI00189642DB|nr:CvpA family protein [Clostridium sp. 'deep sea']QOR34076.1 CvpA family protein [Clostridium sp. 'deep sea']